MNTKKIYLLWQWTNSLARLIHLLIIMYNMRFYCFTSHTPSLSQTKCFFFASSTYSILLTEREMWREKIHLQQHVIFILFCLFVNTLYRHYFSCIIYSLSLSLILWFFSWLSIFIHKMTLCICFFVLFNPIHNP